MQSKSFEMLRLIIHELESRLLGEISTYAGDTTLMAESQEEIKSLLMRVKKKRVKQYLKTNIMASGPIISWHIEKKQMESMTESILGGSKITIMVTAVMKLKDTCS